MNIDTMTIPAYKHGWCQTSGLEKFTEGFSLSLNGVRSLCSAVKTAYGGVIPSLLVQECVAVLLLELSLLSR